MRKFILPTLAALFAATPLFGQDLIVTREGETIETRMVAITDSVVTYRLFSDPGGPVHGIDKSLVRMIKWENGDHDDFGDLRKIATRTPSFDYSALSGGLSIRNNRVYAIGETQLSRREVLEYMESRPDVLRQIKAGYRMKRAAIITGSIGGYFLLAGVTLSIAGNDLGTNYTAAGLVIGGAGLGMGLGSLRKQEKAMRLYNEHHADTGSSRGRDVRLSLAPTRGGGLGLQLDF